MTAKLMCLSLVLILSTPFPLLAEKFEVVRVYDGDTIRARHNQTEINIRLVGIDAPEISEGGQHDGQPFSRKAKEFLESLILQKSVAITGYGYLKHDILLGEIYLGSRNINLEMAQAGMGEITGKEDLPEDLDLAPFLEAEKGAKAAGRGIWSQGENYVSPRVWRERQSSKSGAAILLYGILQQSEK